MDFRELETSRVLPLSHLVCNLPSLPPVTGNESDPAERKPIADAPPSIREFFGRYQRVEDIYGDTRVERSLVGESKLKHGYVRIGEEAEFAEIAVRHGGETPL